MSYTYQHIQSEARTWDISEYWWIQTFSKCLHTMGTWWRKT